MKNKTARTLLLLCALAVAPAGIAQKADQDYEKAVQAYEQGEVAEAYIHLKNALQINPKLVAARILLAQMYFGAGDILGAAKESEEALRLGADINLVLPVYGVSLILQRKTGSLLALEKSSDLFTKATQFEWLLLKGQALLITEQPERARREFAIAAELFPADVRSINSLAAVYLSSGMVEDAHAQILKSILLDPMNAKTWQLRGELAFSQHKFDEALEYFTRANELDVEDLRVLRSLARVNLLLGNQLEMQRHLEMILELSPGDPAATLLNAILMIGQGDVELGDSMLSNLSFKLSALEQVQIQGSDNMLFIRASADYVLRSDQSAITLFNMYLSRNKDDISAIRMLTDLYVRNGEKRLATDLLHASKNAISADMGLSLQLLHFYIQDRNNYAANELLDELKSINANNPYIPILEAEYLRKAGKTAQALELLESTSLDDEELIDYDLLRGALQLEMKDYNAAEKSAEDVGRRYSDVIRAQNFGAVTYLRTGKLDLARASIERALQLAPENIDALFNQAMLMKKHGQLDESAQVINQTLDLRPSHIKSILLMARILYQQGEYEEAIEWTRKVAIYDRSTSRPAELELEIYMRQSDWDNAVKVAASLSRQYPLNSNYQVQLAGLYVQRQEYDLAQRPLHSLSLLWENDPAKLRQLATMFAQAKNIPDARKMLAAALEIDPDSFDIRLDLARLYLQDKEYEMAQSIRQALQKEFGDGAQLFFFQGDIAMSKNQLAEAQKYFLLSYNLDKSNTSAIPKLYELSARGVGGEIFTDTLEARLAEASLPLWAVRLLADSYLIQGKSQKAAHYYEKLLALPEMEADPDLLNNLANIYAQDDLDKGLTTAMKALDKAGGNSPSLLDTIGWILSRKGENEKALPYLRQAYALNSSDAEIRYHTGVALIALERLAEAEKDLRAALVLSDDFPGRGEAKRLLDSLADKSLP